MSGEYVVRSPEGEELKITGAVWKALRDFIAGDRPTGRVEIDFKSGGVCAVRKIETVTAR